MAKRRRKSKENAVYELIRMGLVMIGLATFLMSDSYGITVFVLGFAICAIIGLVIFQKAKEAERLRKSEINEIDKMDGFQFEHYLSVLFKNHGYQAKVTKASGDFGADLILKKDNHTIVVQAKRYSKNIGIKAVQEISAARNYYNANEAWVVGNQEYTSPAKELAKKSNVRLIGRRELIDLILKINGSQKAV